MKVPARRFALSLLFLGVAAAIHAPAFAQQSPASDDDKTAERLEAVTVTGSRIPRADIETAAPRPSP